MLKISRANYSHNGLPQFFEGARFLLIRRVGRSRRSRRGGRCRRRAAQTLQNFIGKRQGAIFQKDLHGNEVLLQKIHERIVHEGVEGGTVGRLHYGVGEVHIGNAGGIVLHHLTGLGPREGDELAGSVELGYELNEPLIAQLHKTIKGGHIVQRVDGTVLTFLCIQAARRSRSGRLSLRGIADAPNILNHLHL